MLHEAKIVEILGLNVEIALFYYLKFQLHVFDSDYIVVFHHVVLHRRICER